MRRGARRLQPAITYVRLNVRRTTSSWLGEGPCAVSAATAFPPIRTPRGGGGGRASARFPGEGGLTRRSAPRLLPLQPHADLVALLLAIASRLHDVCGGQFLLREVTVLALSLPRPPTRRYGHPAGAGAGAQAQDVPAKVASRGEALQRLLVLLSFFSSKVPVDAVATASAPVLH